MERTLDTPADGLRSTNPPELTPAPGVEGVDHIHVHVHDRNASVQWYADVLGFLPVESLRAWATPGGPLTLADASARVHLALFEGRSAGTHTTIAIAVTPAQFMAWRDQLAKVFPQPPRLVDHALAWSLYFSDPDGNPFELTCHAHAQLAAML